MPALRAASRTSAMWRMQLLAPATPLSRSHTLPPSEMKSLYGSITRSPVMSLSDVMSAMLPVRWRPALRDVGFECGGVSATARQVSEREPEAFAATGNPGHDGAHRDVHYPGGLGIRVALNVGVVDRSTGALRQVRHGGRDLTVRQR